MEAQEGAAPAERAGECNKENGEAARSTARGAARRATLAPMNGAPAATPSKMVLEVKAKCGARPAGHLPPGCSPLPGRRRARAAAR